MADNFKQLLIAHEAIQNGNPIPKECRDAVESALNDVLVKTKLNRFIFKPYGNSWLIGVGAVAQVLNTRKNGFKFIHYLLHYPGKSIHCMELYHFGKLDLEYKPPTVINDYSLSTNIGDNARTNIQKQIRLALSEIEIHHKELFTHLSQTLNTGYFVSYDIDPELPIKWELN